jgi:hypothetical protein
MAALKAEKSLDWDGKLGKITNDSDANKLLERQYRKGYNYPKYK